MLQRGFWCVYILECSDSSYYIGITNDLSARITKHNSGLGAKYTRARLPVKLLCYFQVDNRSSALKLEYSLKKKTRKQKSLIIKGGLKNV